MSWLKQSATDTQITHGARLWLYVVAVLVMVWLVIPTLLVIPMSFSASQYLEFPPREWSLRWYKSYFNSLRVSKGVVEASRTLYQISTRST
jgi:putative spermidine/putrescine transport system permease protein